MTANDKKIVSEVFDSANDSIIMAVAMRSAIHLGTPIKATYELLERLNCPMDWEAMLQADLGNFAHDIGGIEQYTNEKGELTNCFLPRFASNQ